MFLTSSVLAYVAGSGGRIYGANKDHTGAAVPGVTVVVRECVTGAKRAGTTNSDDLYAFPALAIGPYELDSDQDGFKPYHRLEAPT